MPQDEILNPQEAPTQEGSTDPTLFDFDMPADTVRHAGQLPEDKGGELAPGTSSAETLTLRGLVAQEGAPVTPDSPAGISEPEALTPTPARERPRVFFDSFLGLFNTRRKKIIAGGAVATAALLTGGALLANGQEAPETRTVTATQPFATPSSASTPHETTMPSPTDIPAVPVAPAPSEASSNTSGELGTVVAVKADFFQGLINPDRITTLEGEIPSLAASIAPSFIVASATEQGVTAANISKYQAAFRKAYSDQAVWDVLGDPQGSMSPEQLLQNTNKAEIASFIPLTSDKFLDNIAQGISEKLPKANASLLELTSLSREFIDKSAAQINSGAVSFDRTYTTDVVAVQSYSTIDGANVTLIETVSAFNNGHKRIGMYVLVPVDGNSDLPADSFVSVLFSSNSL